MSRSPYSTPIERPTSEPLVPLGGVQTGLVLALMLGMLAFWSREPQPFYMPNNDYFSFERLAQNLAAWRWPSDFKRMPVFPGMMGALARFMPGEHPFMQAGLWVNMLLSIGLLWLVYRIARLVVPGAPSLVVLCLAFAPQFQAMARQPLVEPALGFFVALALLLRLQRRPACWIAVGLALLCRLEASVLVPIFLLDGYLTASPTFTADAYTEVGGGVGGDPSGVQAGLTPPKPDARRWGFKQDLWAAGLAVLPMAIWILLGIRYGDPDNSYLTLMKAMEFRPAWHFPMVALEQSVGGWGDEPVTWLWLLGFALVLVGLLVTLARRRRPAWLLLATYAGTLTVILVFGIAKTRYAYAGQWIPATFLVAGLGALAARIRSWRRLPSAVGSLLTIAVASLLVGTVIRGGLDRSREELEWIRHYNYDSYLLGAWMRNLEDPTAGLVTLTTSQVEFMAPTIAHDRVVSFEEIAPTTQDPTVLADAMRRRGLTYAAYTFREQPATLDGLFYHRQKNVYLAEIFAAGGPVPGFDHVASLPLPPELEHTDVQIYRLANP